MTNWTHKLVKTENLSVETLLKMAHPENAREHPDYQLEATEELIETIGLIDEIKCNINSGKVINGHARIKIALQSGQTSLPVNWYDLTEDEERLALEQYDATTYEATYNPDKLRALMEKTKGIKADRPALQAIMERLKAREGIDGNGGEPKEPPGPPEVTETEAEKLAKQYGVKEGQIWGLGQHIIGCLDSLDEGKVKGLIGGRLVRMIWSDPPYGISIVAAHVYVGGGELYDIPFGGVKNADHRRHIPVGGGQRIKDITGRYPIQDWSKNKGLGSVGGAKPFGNEKPIRGSDGASNIVPVGKYSPVLGDETTQTAKKSFCLLYELFPESVHIWWGGNYYTDILPPSPGWIVWDKDNTGNFADCELAWTNQHRAARIFEHRWNGMLKASEQGQRRIHPTQKPIMLAYEIFKEYGNSDDIIFDPFLGSGISVLAAEQLNDGRIVIGCELVPAYIGATIHRWQQMTHQDPILLNE